MGVCIARAVDCGRSAQYSRRVRGSASTLRLGDFGTKYRAAACDITGGMASLNFDATELQIFKGNLGSPSDPNLQYGHFEPYH